MVRNPANPSSEEIEEWAYSEKDEPHEEWELFLIWKEEFKSYLKYASDIRCPKENFFLNLLYYWVWRNVKHDLEASNLSEYRSVFEAAEKINTPYVRIWLSRSKKIMKNDQAFTEEQWRSDRRPYDPLVTPQL